jgi:hypothetical protein
MLFLGILLDKKGIFRLGGYALDVSLSDTD